MKRVLLFVFILMLLGVVALADSKPILFDNEDVRIVAEGAELSKDYVHGGEYLNLKVIVENNTDKQVRVSAENCVIDDWDVDSYCHIEVQPHKKKKDEIAVYYQNSDITSFKKVKTLGLIFNLLFNSEYGTSKTYKGKNIKGKWINSKIGGGNSKSTNNKKKKTSKNTDNSAYKDLKYGDEGIEVASLQIRLMELGYLGPTENGYGDKTVEAVTRFQKIAGLDITGIADSETQVALFDEDAPSNSFIDDDYKSIMRDPQGTWRNAYIIKGKVHQVLEDSSFGTQNKNVKLLVATADGYENLVLVEYTRQEGESRVLEDDTVTFRGEAHGTYQYYNVFNQIREVPYFTTFEVSIN